ncbi:MAG: YwmB family TATA-box binding protein, partial [Alicyclobacillus sp.]|nr:YwmB family TATA-box binding protein [Alicyclobacillus sp.]
VADSPQIDGCIQGKRDARMSGGSEEGLADQAIHAVAAQVQERYHSADSASLSAYTPRVPLHVESNGHPVNIQVAWHDDTRRPQVDVWVGAPILTSTY